MSIERFSSRREALGDVLTKRLRGASRYLRIAGYFRSSLLEVVGEALESVGEIRVVCNGDLDPHDVTVAKAGHRVTLTNGDSFAILFPRPQSTPSFGISATTRRSIPEKSSDRALTRWMPTFAATSLRTFLFFLNVTTRSYVV